MYEIMWPLKYALKASHKVPFDTCGVSFISKNSCILDLRKSTKGSLDNECELNRHGFKMRL